jgi:hypothetical protein
VSLTSTNSASATQQPSVLVVARKEDANVADCIESCRQFSDDVVLLDGSPIDRTAQVLASHPGIRVVRRTCDTRDKQLNFGLHDVVYKHPWLYLCHANERVPAPLARELLARAGDGTSSEAAYQLRSRNFFGGRSIRHAANCPKWAIRLLQPHLANFQGGASPVIRGSVGDLQEHFDREILSSGLAHWLRGRNDDGSAEAQRRVNRGGAGSGVAAWIFLRDYLFRGGFLDGGAGFHYCAMSAMCEYWIDLKVKEHAQPWNEQNEQLAAGLLAEGAK